MFQGFTIGQAREFVAELAAEIAVADSDLPVGSAEALRLARSVKLRVQREVMGVALEGLECCAQDLYARI